MSTINGSHGPRQQLILPKQRPVEAKPVQVQTPAENTVVTYSEIVSMAGDMSEVLAQFQRRARAEKSSSRATDPFERILEEESEPKTDSLYVIAKAPDISKQGFLDFARSLFPDASDFVLVLRELIRRRRASGVAAAQFEEMLEEVWQNTDPKLCQAGLNVGLKARLYSKKMEVSPQTLRDTYREFLISDEGELFQYENWIEQYGSRRRNLVTEFVETSLLHDIQSHDPSCSRLEFGALLGHVVKLKKLQAADLGFLQVFLRGNPNALLLEDILLQCWFDCLQRPFNIKKEIETNHLRNLAKSLHLPEGKLQQKLLLAIRQLDDDFFLENEIKQILIDSLLNFQPIKNDK